ncbi:dolichyl-phosphate beta-D-mannosyltransferase [bacterium]|nr:dolichyl-phosphate beta-D-mannosyltransferase [bacterium]|tara:strand:+ start:187 stop:900 length:714 start_codon:yes stop_codon:yes gene_type:complete
MLYINIPTYNEAGNIDNLVEKISALGLDNYRILFIDDNSPDSTADVVRKIKNQNKQVELLVRETDKGFRLATITGLKHALAQGADRVLTMDCDLSHNPSDIPRILEKSKHADVVVGSRYIRGGGVQNWHWLRRLISRSGNLYVRFILGLPVKDCTGSFRCYQSSVLKTIDFTKLRSSGYAFAPETLFHVHRHGFKVVETPIIFTERQVGESKFNSGMILEGLIGIFLLAVKYRWRKP